MTFPIVSQTVAFRGVPYNVLDFPVLENELHVELSQCPGTLGNPNAGWHQNWIPFDSIFVPINTFIISQAGRRN
jgi:hypothetical protein